MGKVISFTKFVKKNTANVDNNSSEETVDSSSTEKKGWHFASLDESDAATIFRFLGYLLGSVFFLISIPAGFASWVQRGLFFSFVCLSLSYLLVLRKK
jgi:hypothetical protein